MKSENETLAAQPWFVDLLAAKGFHRSSPNSFTNHKASINIEGFKLTANPSTGGKVWTTELGAADQATVKMIVEQILKMRPFLTDAELASQRAEKERLERALTGIGNTIKECPDTHSGVELRRFLWSLYNSYHVVNLYHLASVLDSKRAGWVAEVFVGALVGVLGEDDIKRALLVAGELERWDEVRPLDETQKRLDEALDQIEALLGMLPPSRAHAETRSARERLWEAKDALRRAKEPERQES